MKTMWKKNYLKFLTLTLTILAASACVHSQTFQVNASKRAAYFWPKESPISIQCKYEATRNIEVTIQIKNGSRGSFYLEPLRQVALFANDEEVPITLKKYRIYKKYLADKTDYNSIPWEGTPSPIIDEKFAVKTNLVYEGIYASDRITEVPAKIQLRIIQPKLSYLDRDEPLEFSCDPVPKK